MGGEGADQIGCTSSQEELDVTPRGPETAAGPGSGWDGDGRRSGAGPSGAQKPPGAAACLLSSPPVQTAGPVALPSGTHLGYGTREECAPGTQHSEEGVGC